MGSILKRIASAFASAFKWIQSLFCTSAGSSQEPSPSIPPRSTPSTPLTPSRVTSTTPANRTEQLFQFYRGAGVDVQQRTLAQIWAWNDDQLESVHDYIQWLFPTRQASSVNAQAPLLNATIIQAFRNEPVLRNNLLISFNRMLRFYGLQLDEGRMQITRAPNASARQRIWLTLDNHNYKRITRMLACLRTLGFPEQAQAFHRILNDIAQHEGRHAVEQQTLEFWRNAARA